MFKNIKIMLPKAIIICTALLLIVAITFFVKNNFTIQAVNYMDNVKANNVETKVLGSDFERSNADFSIDLFKKSLKSGENAMISPTSVYLALAMVANGADKNTLKEFETLLGKYNLSLSDINKYDYSFQKQLKDIKSGKFSIANSVWYRDESSLVVDKAFLQTNADYFGADVFKADFNSPKTVNDINLWVKTNTGGLIDNIVDKIDSTTMMHIFNTLYFEAKWEQVYDKQDVGNGDFTLANGSKISTKFLNDNEIRYLEDAKATGFIKQYENEQFGFVALLPNKGISAEDYAATLTGDTFTKLIKNQSIQTVYTSMPKFKADYDVSLIAPLEAMGLRDAFSDSANFSKMSNKDLYISAIQHKTFIQVDELGTKAGAVTKITMDVKSAAPAVVKEVILDRPFVYAIIDNTTSLPIFIGIMNNPKA